jgi:hypothetical protein
MIDAESSYVFLGKILMLKRSALFSGVATSELHAGRQIEKIVNNTGKVRK